jgi:ribosomal protein L20A (L18A)
VRGANNISHHVLVERIDGQAKLRGEFGKGFSNCLDLGSSQVLEASGKSGIGFTGLVVDLRSVVVIEMEYQKDILSEKKIPKRNITIQNVAIVEAMIEYPSIHGN